MAALSRRARDRRVIGSGPSAGRSFAVEVPTHVTALIDYAGGQAATLVLSFDSPLRRSGFAEITGTEATLALPDPNRFDGEVRVRPAGAADWTSIPAAGTAAGRGLGVLDLARALRAGVPHRASGELALHVLDTMEAIGGFGRDGRVLPGARPASACRRRCRQTGTRGPPRWDERPGRRREATAVDEGTVDEPVREGAARPALGVGMVGYGFMGAAHSQAWRTAAHVLDLPLTPRMVALCGRDAAAAAAAARRYGWASAESDWRALIGRPDVQLIDICAPGDAHAEIAIAALDAGQHVLCEKPLATTVPRPRPWPPPRPGPAPAASAR